MALIPVNELGQYGIVRQPDRYPHELPINAWSAGKNVRFRDGMVEKFFGNQSVGGVPTVAPYWTMPITIGSTTYWIYAGLGKVYSWDGGTHTDITRLSGGDYSATTLRNWTGAVLGGIPILNNGVDVPQMWRPPGAGNRLSPLGNWPTGYSAGAMRAFRRFLIAMDITKGGVNYSKMVKWSHPAPVGDIPPSWDEADETRDAGEIEIGDTEGPVLDGVKMRDQFVLYKNDSVHWMQYVGGVEVFRFPGIFDSFGMLAKRCAVEYAKGNHAVFAQGDLITHNAQSWESIVSGRMRRWIFNQLDANNFPKSFVVSNPNAMEVWFCFPTAGSVNPNLAAVWNWKENSMGIRDINFNHATNGRVAITLAGDTWNSDPQVWNLDPSTWDEGTSDPIGQRMLAASPSLQRLLMEDSTNQFDGTDLECYVERTGIQLPLKVGGPPDLANVKFITEFWPRILGTQGGIVKVSFGSQERPQGPVVWEKTMDYVIGETQFLDPLISTRLLALKFESDTPIEWRLAGYEVNVEDGGRH